jgi:hypothetical protein
MKANTSNFGEAPGSDRASSIIAFNFVFRSIKGDGALFFKCLPVVRKRLAKSSAAAVVASPQAIRALASSSSCFIACIDFFTSSGWPAAHSLTSFLGPGFPDQCKSMGDMLAVLCQNSFLNGQNWIQCVRAGQKFTNLRQGKPKAF